MPTSTVTFSCGCKFLQAYDFDTLDFGIACEGLDTETGVFFLSQGRTSYKEVPKNGKSRRTDQNYPQML